MSVVASHISIIDPLYRRDSLMNTPVLYGLRIWLAVRLCTKTIPQVLLHCGVDSLNTLSALLSKPDRSLGQPNETHIFGHIGAFESERCSR
ncbi:hypothetical protein RA263_19915 [Pseudomonas syringae pv. tagetis]|uniref:Uncharacterized protein n=2 Tax=Pseudomonas syringae group genomosp. 7 TaxID=251699 RepID=A0A3M6CM43_9PSED|nr:MULTISPECIES: hypothetical protein [Pseudomonas syringae group]RMV44491.1 hypothetical protein ALP10_200154 [Pseudomonas syringae pv. helianthi]RMW08504.1 hypothetical protein ALO98_200321 [Pseudomonas syringae pv. tagetis]UNB62536.1 hypothetical protein MME54_23505 [Pseudomonas syringae pv. helianthi]UNB69350.1 hypothetical protein MME58_03570 [Pseudomonas syringae pv. tagetis]